jgi:hypothetical protein
VPGLAAAGDQPQRRHEALLGKRRNRRLLGRVELDTYRRDAKQHGDDTVAAGKPANYAAVAVDEHENSFRYSVSARGRCHFNNRTNQH